jgi:hypothetical protein
MEEWTCEKIPELRAIGGWLSRPKAGKKQLLFRRGIWFKLNMRKAFVSLGFKKLSGVVAFVAVGAVCGTSAQAQLTIIPTWDSTITNDPNAAVIEAGIQAAIGRVDAALFNPITVNIDFQEVSGGLGESLTSQYFFSYSDYRSVLANNQILSANDNTALASLPIQSANPANGNSTAQNLQVAATLLRALGVSAPGFLDSSLSNNQFDGSFDGVIGLNTSIINLSRTGPQNPSFYDLQAVAGHEIDEVLGIGGTGSTLALNGSYTGQAAPTGSTGVLDLFRYASSGVRSFTLNPNVNAYFSIDGGNTDLVNFEQNNHGADFSDWGNGTPNAQAGNSPPQIQDAYGTPGVDTNIGTSELTALDVVGYDLTPEPGSTALLVTAAGALLGFRRRNNAAA